MGRPRDRGQGLQASSPQVPLRRTHGASPYTAPPSPALPHLGFHPDRSHQQESRAHSWRNNCRAPSGRGRPICPCSNPALLPLAFCAHRAHQQDSRSRLKDELQSTRRERRAALQAELQRTQAACSAELAQLQAAGAAEVAVRRAEVEAELTARGVAVEAELLRAAQAMEQTERGLVQRAGELEAAQVSVELDVWSGCGVALDYMWSSRDYRHRCGGLTRALY